MLSPPSSCCHPPAHAVTPLTGCFCVPPPPDRLLQLRALPAELQQLPPLRLRHVRLPAQVHLHRECHPPAGTPPQKTCHRPPLSLGMSCWPAAALWSSVLWPEGAAGGCPYAPGGSSRGGPVLASVVEGGVLVPIMIVQGCPHPRRVICGVSLSPGVSSRGVLVPRRVAQGWPCPGEHRLGGPWLHHGSSRGVLSQKGHLRGVPVPRRVIQGGACVQEGGPGLALSIISGVPCPHHRSSRAVPIPESITQGHPCPRRVVWGCPCPQEGGSGGVPVPGTSLGVKGHDLGRGSGPPPTLAPRPKELSGFTLDQVAFEDGKGKCPYDPTKGHTGLIVGRWHLGNHGGGEEVPPRGPPLSLP